MPKQMLHARFGDSVLADFGEYLDISDHERPLKMVGGTGDGTGEPLLVDGRFGADVIRFAAGGSTGFHTHEGAHILFVMAGTGVVHFGPADELCEEHDLEPGVCYLIPSDWPHSIDARTDLVLIAVANRHNPVDSEARRDDA